AFDDLELDILIGVASRRALNRPLVRSGNVAADEIVRVLERKAPDGRFLYGLMMAPSLDRGWRAPQPGTHVMTALIAADCPFVGRGDAFDPRMQNAQAYGSMQISQATTNADMV